MGSFYFDRQGNFVPLFSPPCQNSEAAICIPSKKRTNNSPNRRTIRERLSRVYDVVNPPFIIIVKPSRRRVHSCDSAFTSSGMLAVYYCRYRGEPRVVDTAEHSVTRQPTFLHRFVPHFPLLPRYEHRGPRIFNPPQECPRLRDILYNVLKD